MNVIRAIIMGFVQGLTEFLPISSSGHLVLARNILGFKAETGIFFEVMLHVGTLISVLIVFYKDILEMIKEFFGVIGDLAAEHRINIGKSPHRNMLAMVVVATIPTGAMGFFFGDIFEKAFSSLRIVSLMLLLTGTFLYLANRIKVGHKQPEDIKFIDAVFIGIFQGLAITPGISRSGSTIFAGLTRGFSRELATKFSFIMSLPAILGASVLELKSYLEVANHPETPINVLIGMIAATVSGTLAIKFLVNILNRGKLNYFSYYCWAVGVIGIIASL